MINIHTCTTEPTRTKQAFEQRGIDLKILENLICLEQDRKRNQQKIDEMREKRNQLSQQIGQNPTESEEAKDQVKKLKVSLTEQENRQQEIEKQLNKLVLRIPNFPDDDVPIGQSEAENVTIFESKIPETLHQQKKPHWEIRPTLNGIDFERGVKLSGSRFYVLYGHLAQLQRALIQYLLHTLANAGFTEVQVPYMVHQSILEAAGQLPKFAENLYRDHLEDYWLIPTAEVPLTGLHKDEIILAEDLPRYYSAHTPCFRREKASAGKDGRGMKRGHQFDKVEMYALCTPTQAESVFKKMMAVTETVCKELELPYRHKRLCTGDLGFAASKTIDVEVWAAGCKEWLEVSTVSLCRDFQARRAKIRYKEGKKKALCYTLNGSCLGIPRTMIALIENNNKNGRIYIPKPLQKWMQTETITL